MKVPCPPFPYHHRSSCRDLGNDHNHDFGPWTKVRLSARLWLQQQDREIAEGAERARRGRG